MATVTRVVAPTVGLQSLPDVRLTGRMDPSAADPIIRGMQSIGGAVYGIIEEQQQKADTASLLEAQRKLGDWERSWFDANNPDSVYAHKGKDALKVNERIDADFEKVNAEIGNNLQNPRVREMYERYAMGKRESILDRTNAYAVKEHEGYVQAEYKAAILGSVDAGARARLDGRLGDAQAEMQRGLGVLQAQAQLNGEPPEMLAIQKQAYVSGVHATTINGYHAAGRVADANAYLADHAAEMSTEDVTKAMAALRPALMDELAYRVADGAVAGVTPADYGGDTATVDQLWSALERQESGGKQSAVSVKGAVGVAQVMPKTGPEAAALAGVAWDAKRFKEDASYNRALGQAYLKKQIDTYGSAPMALAAYNAGPGRVNEWIAKYGDPRTGAISMQDWVEAIPLKETKNYVTTIMGNSAGGAVTQKPTQQVVRVPDTLEQRLQRSARGLPAEARQRAEQVITMQWNREQDQRQLAEREASRDIYGIVNGLPPGSDWRKAVTPQQREFADRMNMTPHLDQMSQGKQQVTPPDVKLHLDELVHLAAMGNARAVERLQGFNAYDPKLQWASEDRARIAKLQEAIRAGSKKAVAAEANAAEVGTTIATFAQQNLGISKAMLKTDANAQQRYNNFDTQMRLWISDYSAAHQGKKPSFRELQEHADGLTFKVPAVTGRMGGITEVPALEFRAEHIPKQHMDQVLSLLKRDNPGVTEFPERAIKIAYMKLAHDKALK